MLDIQFIRDNREQVERAADSKNIKVDIGRLLELDEQRRQLNAETDELRRQRNELAGRAKGGKPSTEDIAQGKQLKVKITEHEEKLQPIQTEYESLLKQVPNIATDDTPVGQSEADNQVVYEWGERPIFDFTPKNHWEMAEANGWIDKERAAKVTGARFAYIKGPLVLLQQAVIQHTFSVLTDESKLQAIIDEFKVEGVASKPFTPILPPLVLKTEVFDAMDRLEPREDRYKIEGEELWLQGSAEHVMGSMHMDEILEESDLPIRYVGFASSFRKEAGSYGKDMEGIIRMHQFDKLEMEILSTPESGLNEHMLTIAIQEFLTRSLNLPYRKLLKSTADIGKPNARGVDLDVWLPGQNTYRETHTADYMTDYQTRRLQTKLRRSSGEISYAYTIDATAFALGRTLVAIMENYQTKDGQVRVPEVLKSFMGGRETL